MKNTNEEHQKEGISPVTAAVTGAVIGAGAAVAGTMALKDEKSRKKVKDTIITMKNKTMEYFEERNGNGKSKAQDAIGKVKKEISSGKHSSKKPVARPAVAA